MKGEIIWNHPDLIAICTGCEKDDCRGSCARYDAKYRELAGLPPKKTKPEKSKEPKAKPAPKKPGETLKRYEAFGQGKTLREWSEAFGIKYATLHQRINRDGLSMEEALSRRIHKGGENLISWKGLSMNLREWAEAAGLSMGTLRNRLARGETMPYALRGGRMFPSGDKCGFCAHHIGGGHCLLNLEGECREGGGYEAFSPIGGKEAKGGI